jgi:hypothetical protein
MERKRALVIAGSVSLTLLVGSAAAAANLALLHEADSTGVGSLDAGGAAELVTTADSTTTTVTTAQVIVVDAPGAVPAPGSGAGSPPLPAADQAVPTAPGPVIDPGSPGPPAAGGHDALDDHGGDRDDAADELEDRLDDQADELEDRADAEELEDQADDRGRRDDD